VFACADGMGEWVGGQPRLLSSDLQRKQQFASYWKVWRC